MSTRPRQPAAFRITPETGAAKPKARPSAAKSKAGSTPDIEVEPEPQAGIPPLAAFVARRTRASRWLAILFSAFTGLVTMWAGLAFTQLIEALFARSAILGWIASALLIAGALALVAIIARELAGLARLRKLASIHDHAAHALASGDQSAADQTLQSLKALYAGRSDAAWGLARLKEQEDEVIDPADRVRLAERDILKPLDGEAKRIMASAARRVALLTAVTPAAALDILLVGAQNLAMLRALATLYGGRPGSIGTLKLARMVIAHLAIAGGLALSDSLVQHVVGRGILGRLSSRFGEGALNGILTARIGLAALDLCRPLPFIDQQKPSLADLLQGIASLGDSAPGDTKQPVK